MTETMGFAERRMHKRFKAKDGAFALLKNGLYKLGQINDISKGGLAFTYPADEHQIPESFFVDVFFSQQGYYLKEVPSNKISDVIVSSDFPLSGLISILLEEMFFKKMLAASTTKRAALYL
jgi:hypothetical protein